MAVLYFRPCVVLFIVRRIFPYLTLFFPARLFCLRVVLYLFSLCLEFFLYLFYPILTIFPIGSFVHCGPIYRVSTFFHPMIKSQNFANRAPCRDFVKKSASMYSVMQYEIDILLLLVLSLAKK